MCLKICLVYQFVSRYHFRHQRSY